MNSKTSETSEKILAGFSVADITPQLPAPLVGQYYKRIAHDVHSRLCASVMAVGSPDGKEALIFVQCDLLAVSRKMLGEVREAALRIDPSIDPESIVLAAIHTHTAPYTDEDEMTVFWGDDFKYRKSADCGFSPSEYRASAVKSIAGAVVSAWQSRKPLSVHSGFDYISISYNRRVLYKDGHAEMYGSTARDDFDSIEGTSDQGIHFICFYDGDRLAAAVIEVACPSQVLEHHSYISSDFWDEVRKRLRARYGDDFTVIPMCGSAGDLSPRDLVRMAMPEPEMHKEALYNEEGTYMIADKICGSFFGFESAVDKTAASETGFRHICVDVPLDLRVPSGDELEKAKKAHAALRGKHDDIESFTEGEQTLLSMDAAVMLRAEMMRKTRSCMAEIHAARIGGAKLVTNPFELYVAHADRIRASCGGHNILSVQLCCDYLGYLATRPAVSHGGYSASVCNSFISSDGADELVRLSSELLKKL